MCVSSWSFHTSFETDRNNPAKVLMDPRDFPEMIADRYHVHNIELVLPHLGAASRRWSATSRRASTKRIPALVNMPLDFGVLWNKPAISSTDADRA